MIRLGRLPLWWRHLLLAGAVLGLIAAPGPLDATPGWLGVCAVSLPALLWVRARALRRPLAAVVWSALAIALGAVLGLGLGEARSAALEGAAFDGEAGAGIVAEGYVSGAPRASIDRLRFPLKLPEGRLIVDAERGREAEIGIGDRLRVRGTLAEPEPFRADELERAGVRLELHATMIAVRPGGRSGPAGVLDRARTRAEGALTAGLDHERAALARGFVLGQDDRISPEVREAFRRSGLAHLLAVSGQNVMLLAILGGVLFTVAGVGSRTRLILVLALIALYVPIAGGAASIQRAGIMGGAGILAGLAGRPTDRLYVLLLAACATLLLNPHSASEVGWQLSFAAVGGIALWAQSLRSIVLARLGRLPERLAAPLAEGAALTLAATLATGPLMVHHFEAFSLASLPANLLVLPAVAPVMWLGMAAAMVGQLPLLPAEPIAWLEGPLLSYIAGVAEVFAAPEWALLEVPAGSLATTAVAYLTLAAGAFAGIRALHRRSGVGVPRPFRVAAALVLLLALLPSLLRSGPAIPPPLPEALRITQLDVGQGDAILLQAGARAALVDTGPPGAGLADQLVSRGIGELDAVLVTHDQLDHAGGLRELVGRVRFGRLFLAGPADEAEAAARSVGARTRSIRAGASLALGPARLRVLWPPAPTDGGGTGGADPNLSSLVIAVEHDGFHALLTGDAEAEATRLDPGPLDLLKIAHHGSADAGLERMLDGSLPRVALIGVGAGNPHGHPAAETIAALEQRGVCVLRTDLHGDAWVEFGAGGLRAGTEQDSDPCPLQQG